MSSIMYTSVMSTANTLDSTRFTLRLNGMVTALNRQPAASANTKYTMKYFMFIFI